MFLCFLQDYDLCVRCYNDKGHEHKMERLGLDLDLDQQQETGWQKGTTTAHCTRGEAVKKSSVVYRVWYMLHTAVKLTVHLQAVQR